MLMRKTKKKNTMTLIMMLASSEVVVQIGWRWCCRRPLWSAARRLLSPPTRPLTHSHPPTSQPHKYKHKYKYKCKFNCNKEIQITQTQIGKKKIFCPITHTFKSQIQTKSQLQIQQKCIDWCKNEYLSVSWLQVRSKLWSLGQDLINSHGELL